jgi:hypothetical protein
MLTGDAFDAGVAQKNTHFFAIDESFLPDRPRPPLLARQLVLKLRSFGRAAASDGVPPRQFHTPTSELKEGESLAHFLHQ